VTRTALAAFTIVLASLLVPVAVSAGWLSLRVDETEAYVDTVAPLADDPELRAALSERVARAAVGKLQRNVPIGLPRSLERRVRQTTDRVVESPGFPQFWRQANAEAHREFLAIVHERPEDLESRDGWITVDLRPLLDQVIVEFAEAYGIPPDMVPSTALPIPVLPESRLADVRGGYNLLNALALWLPPLWLALVAVGVLAARGWRSRLRAAAAAGLGLAIGAGLVLLLTPSATDLVVDQAGPDQQELVRLVIEVVVSSLGDTARTVAVVGLVAAVALFAGSLWPRRAPESHP
jgi:hypothetical protein